MSKLKCCINIRGYCQKSQNQSDCDCWKEYSKHTSDSSMTFERWNKEAHKQYEEDENEWRNNYLKKGVHGVKAFGGKIGDAGSWRCG